MSDMAGNFVRDQRKGSEFLRSDIRVGDKIQKKPDEF